MIKNQSLIN